MTLQDIAKMTHNKDMIAIAERMTLVNEVIQDAVWKESNGITSHKFSFRVKLARGAWRLFNQGVVADSGKVAQGTAYMGLHENRVKADRGLMKIAPSPEKAFSTETYAHSEGSAQVLAETIFYGNHNINPAQFHGIAPQMDILGDNLFTYSGGGASSGSMSSLYGIDWGEEKAYMVYPKGAKVPYEITPKYEGVAIDPDNGGEYNVWRCEVIMNCGLVIEDPRAVFRYGNLIPEAGYGNAGGFDEKVLNKALNKMKNRGKTAKIYGNQDLLTEIENRATDKANVQYSSKEIFGVPVVHFKGRPLRLCESIVSTEATIPAA